MGKIDASHIPPQEGEVFPGEGPHGIAVYRDSEGNLHVFSADCPHAHCDVVWENNTKEWYCPCHSSRFTPEGKVVEGPAREDLKKLKARTEGDVLTIDEESEE
jgi:Rieske Fe-S protein